MYRTFLVGLDGSHYRHAAVELAVRWANRLDAMVVGLGVIDEPTIRGPAAVPIGAAALKHEVEESQVAEATHRVEALLSEFERRCTEAAVPHKLLEETGYPADRIVLESQRFDLVILGQKTFFHFETQDAPCDTLKTVLKHCPRPVVTAPETLREGSSIVVAYDGSQQSARAIAALQSSGLAKNHRVHIVSMHDDRVEAARVADRAVEYLRAHDQPATAHPNGSTDSIGATLLREAEALDAELIVMGAYGNSAIKEFFVGSVTRHVLENSKIPLMLYH